MNFNAALGDKAQNALLWVDADTDLVSEHLSAGEDKTAWDAAAVAVRQAAIQFVSVQCGGVPWCGGSLFGYQPLTLPRSELCRAYSATAGDDSETTSIVCDGLKEMAAEWWDEGAVHIGDSEDADYGTAARITAYDHTTGTFTCAAGLSASPAGKSVVIVTALPLAVRQAIAREAARHLQNQDSANLVASIAHGRTSTTGDPGTANTLRNVPLWRAAFDPWSIYQIGPWFSRSVTIGRA